MRTTFALLFLILQSSGYAGVHAVASARASGTASLRPSFHANAGQFPPAVRYAAAVRDGRVYLTEEGAVAVVAAGERTRALSWRLRGARKQEPVAEQRLSGVANYLIGERSRWRTGVPTFDRVRYPAALPGVDVVYYRQPGAVEFDLQVSPGVNPDALRLTIDGASSVHVNGRDGSLVLAWPGGEMRWQAPEAYQGDGKARRAVPARYRIEVNGDVGFEIGDYDRGKPLVIDPVLLMSTLVGGTASDFGSDLVVDGAGRAYLVGSTQSFDFPTTPGAFDTTQAAEWDAFVARLAADGSSLDFATFLGGAGTDGAGGVALDALGNVYVTGSTTSADFPSLSAYRPTYTATQCVIVATATEPCRDAFVAKLSPDGDVLLYSTFFGGSHHDSGLGIDVNDAGQAFVLGTTTSGDLPLLNAVDGVYEPSGCGAEGLPRRCPDAFVMSLSSAGSVLQYSTYLGGDFDETPGDIVVDAANRITVVGSTNSANFPVAAALQPARAVGSCGVTPAAFYCHDLFVSRIVPAAGLLEFSTYFGGNGDDRATDLVLDPDQTIWVTGHTTSTNLPLANPLQAALAEPAPAGSGCLPTGGTTIVRCPDALIARFSANGGTLLMSTYLGGLLRDEARAIAQDASGRIAIAGATQSSDFPVVDAWQWHIVSSGGCSFQSVCADAFVTVLTPGAATIAYSTYLGSFDNDVAETLDAAPDGSLFVGGSTGSYFGTTPGAFRAAGTGLEAFVARIAAPPANGLLVTIAGTGEAGAPVAWPTQALRTSFGAPADVAVHNFVVRYVADAASHRVLRIDPSNLVTVVAGDGTPGGGGDGGPAVDAQLNTPNGVAVDAAGNVYIADSGNHRIRVVRSDGVISTIAGTGAAGFSGDGGASYLAELNYPFGVVAAADKLIVADTGNSRIRMITSDAIISTIAGNGTAGSSGDGGPSVLASLSLPTGVAIDPGGGILVADFGAHNVRRIDWSGVITRVAGTGMAGSAGDGGPAALAQLSGPFGIDATAAGYIIVSELSGHRIRAIVNGGIFTLAGTGSTGPILAPPQAATASPLSFPSGVAFDGLGNVLITERGNPRVAMARFAGP